MQRTLAALLALAASCGPEPEAPARPVPPPPPGVPAPPEAGLVAFVRGGEVWTMRPDGGAARAVTRLAGSAADPAWSPDRRWIAFAAGGRPDLLARNLFVVRPDGSELRQVTPMPRADLSHEDSPKGTLQGRAVYVDANGKRPAAGLRVTLYGLARELRTDAEGKFHTFMPAGGGWIKLAGAFDGRPVAGSMFVSIVEGKTTDVQDLVVRAGGDDAAAAPSWTPDGATLYYQLRHGRLDSTGLSPTVSVRRIRPDGRNDETFYAPSRATILAGPVIRKGEATVKTSDGRLLAIDLATRSPRAGPDRGAAVPDLLALSPDGAAAVTRRGDELVLVRGDAVEVLAAFARDDPLPRAADFSPDGARLVMDRWTPDGRSDLWTLDVAARRFARLTEDGVSSSPVWHGR